MESKKKKKVSKLLKKHFKSIKFLFFFQIFHDYRGGVGGSDQIWKIPDFFFEPFPNKETKNKEIFASLLPIIRKLEQKAFKIQGNSQKWT